MRIALIGHGKMGSALLAQWCRAADSAFPDHTFFVIDPAADAASVAAHAGSNGAASRVTFLPEPPAAEQCGYDLVIVAIKPQLVDAILPAYRLRLAKGGFVASIAAGCSIARLRALAGGVAAIRIMPNLPAAIGAGVSGLCADDSASPDQRAAVEALMAAVGTTLWVDDEDKLDRLTAIAGSGPGYIFEIAHTYVQSAQALGFSADEAKQLVLGTLAGSIAIAEVSAENLEELRTSVTSKNGTTAAGLAKLNGDGAMSALMRATVNAAYRRAVELR